MGGRSLSRLTRLMGSILAGGLLHIGAISGTLLYRAAATISVSGGYHILAYRLTSRLTHVKISKDFGKEGKISALTTMTHLTGLSFANSRAAENQPTLLRAAACYAESPSHGKPCMVTKMMLSLSNEGTCLPREASA